MKAKEQDLQYLMEKALDPSTTAEEASEYRKQAMLLAEANLEGQKVAGEVDEETYRIKLEMIKKLLSIDEDLSYIHKKLEDK